MKSLVLFLLFLLSSGSTHPSSLSITTNRVLDIQTFIIPKLDISKFASIVLKYFDTRRCIETNLASPEGCAKLGSIPRSNMNVYVGYDKRTDLDEEEKQNEDKSQQSGTFGYSLGKVGLSPNLLTKRAAEVERRHKVVSILPDSSNVKITSEHDIVIVIDPYPDYNFGHFVALFYLDMDVDSGKCDGKHQLYLPDRTCISPVKKPRCQGSMADENFKRFHHSPKCYIDFLPTVRRARDFGINSTENLMECVNLPEFRNCPKLVYKNENDYSKAASEPRSEIRTRCRLFQRCDRGILIGGGWNPLQSTLKSEENVRKMESMLILNGFLKENIKIFFGNGGGESGESLEKGSEKLLFHSLSLKAELRKHITKICESKHCADTFFIYLNTPTTSNGNYLLWDNNRNGMAEDTEIYTPDEFLSDISKCEAQRVIIVADQRKGDILMSLLQKSNMHSNVVLSVANLSDQPTINGELTTIWNNHSHPVACLKHIHQAANLWMKGSVPAIYDSSGGSLLNLSISGAPCGELYARELRLQYQGCQNLPTSIWFSSLTYGTEFSESSDEIVGDGKPFRDSNVSYSRKYT